MRKREKEREGEGYERKSNFLFQPVRRQLNLRHEGHDPNRSRRMPTGVAPNPSSSRNIQSPRGRLQARHARDSPTG